MKGMPEQMSLFDIEGENKLDEQTDVLHVVKSSFITDERVNWSKLFDGFNEIYAITYSSGIDFVAKVLDRFDYGEVIFGNEKVLGDDLATVPENSNTYELKYIYEELPPELDARHASRTLKMKLSEAERFFGIRFKKKIFEK